MKLEIKHIAPYLPYELKGMRSDGAKEIYYLAYINPKSSTPLIWSPFDFFGDSTAMDMKPILRPLSDLTKEIEVNGEKFVPRTKMGLIHDVSGNNILNYRTGDRINIFSIPYYQIEYLFEWHFDIFGLIEKGLAIDINTI